MGDAADATADCGGQLVPSATGAVRADEDEDEEKDEEAEEAGGVAVALACAVLVGTGAAVLGC